MFVCVCALWNVYSSSKCVCERAWFLSGCGLWLMELLVETALGWLQLQAALVSSLTYDNAPATLTPQCCSSSVVDGCSCFFFFFFFFSLLPYFAPLIRLLLSFSRSVYLAVVYINAQSKCCHLERLAESVPNLAICRWRLLGMYIPPVLT